MTLAEIGLAQNLGTRKPCKKSLRSERGYDSSLLMAGFKKALALKASALCLPYPSCRIIFLLLSSTPSSVPCACIKPSANTGENYLRKTLLNLESRNLPDGDALQRSFQLCCVFPRAGPCLGKAAGHGAHHTGYGVALCQASVYVSGFWYFGIPRLCCGRVSCSVLRSNNRRRTPTPQQTLARILIPNVREVRNRLSFFERKY